MSMMDRMMGLMMGRMSKEEKAAMMDGMMDKFFADMTADDKSKLMTEMMPKMMEGVNMMEMMPQMMMGMMGGEGGEGGMMSMMGGEKSEGGMMGMMDKLPGMSNLPDNVKDKVDDKMFKHMEAIINSMTMKERQRPELIKGSRKKRIAAGSGTQVQGA